MYNNCPAKNIDSDIGMETAKETEIGSVIGKLHQQIDMIHKEFSFIEQRITPILSPKLQEEAEKAVNSEYSTGLAQDINNAVRKLNSFYEHLKSIRGNIEL